MMDILIADDDVTTRISLCLTVEKWGYQVVSANNGQETLNILQNNDQPTPQLFLIDWIMPELDGIEVCRQIRQNTQTQSAYILILTSRNKKNDLLQALEAGADDFLTKPFFPDELKARLNNGKRIITLQNSLANQIEKLEKSLKTLQKTEATLEETKDYRNLFKHANDSIIVFDAKSQAILKVNDKACETYQIKRKDFIGLTFDNLAQSGFQQEEIVKKVIEKGQAEEFEIIHLRSDKKPMSMLVNASLVEFNGRQAILSVNRDITDRREIELRIENALQEWSDTVDAVSDMIILTDSENRIRRCNKATSQFFNQSYSELIGKTLYEVCKFSPESKDFVKIGETYQENSKYFPLNKNVWEGRIPHQPDEWFEITNHRVLLSKNNQEKENQVFIIKNISERKKTESSLTLLNTALEQAADNVIVTDQKGVIEYVNPSFSNCTGWTFEESVGCNIFDLHAADLKKVIGNENSTFILPNKVWQGIFRAQRKSGEIYEEEISISPIKNKQEGEILNYVAVCRDVTEKRRLESIAEAVNMMQNVGYVFSGIRHELGNPINSVKTALVVLKKNLFKWQTQQIDTYIERCLTETERVEYLLKALKTFSMYENPQMERVLLTAFIKNFITLAEEDFNKLGLQINLISPLEVGEALCDSRALHQILLNLFTNAADALNGRDNPQIQVSLHRDKGRIYVCIEDNGCGMSEQQVENSFKPFYTSKENGTGLGLVIVKKMITKMNGTIYIESCQNIGSKVHFTLEAVEN